jgi:transposase
MPRKRDRNNDKADEGECAEYMIGGCHDVEEVRKTTVFRLCATFKLSMRSYGTFRD